MQGTMSRGRLVVMTAVLTAFSASVLAPTPAAAWWRHGWGWHHGWGYPGWHPGWRWHAGWGWGPPVVGVAPRVVVVPPPVVYAPPVAVY